MIRVTKWACSLASCICCGILSGIGSTVEGAARRHQSIGRSLYLVLFIAVLSLSWIMYNLPTWIDSAHYVSYLPSFAGCGTNTTAIGKDSTKAIDWLLQHEFGTAALSIPERLCFGTLSTLRVMSTLTVFHLLMALFMIGASNNKEGARYEIQHGWWLMKLIIIILFIITTFFGLENDTFIMYRWVALVGSAVFILVQIFLMVEFAHRTSATLAQGYSRAVRAGRAGKCCMGCGMLLLVILCYIGGIVFLSFVFALAPGQKACSIVWAAPLATLVISIITTFGAIIAHRTSRGGIAPAAVIILYSSYLTWSAFSPMALQDAGCTPTTTSTVGKSNRDDSVAIVYVTRLLGIHVISHDAQNIILLGVSFLALVYTTVRTSTAMANESQTTTTPADPETVVPSNEFNVDEEEETNVDSEDDPIGSPPPLRTTYNFSIFHLIFALGSMYAAMVLTGWNDVNTKVGLTSTVFVNHTVGAMWVKLITAWVTLVVYTWTVFAPLICRKKATPAHL